MPERAEKKFKPITDAEFERLKELGLALFGLKPKIDGMISREVDAQEELEHQGVNVHPLVLERRVRAVADRIADVAERYKDSKLNPVNWGEYIEIVMETLALIQEIDPDNEVLLSQNK